MSSRTVTELLDDLAQVVRAHQFGRIQLIGNLTGSRGHRSGFATGELTTGRPSEPRLRVVANRHAAAAVRGELADAGRAPTEPGGLSSSMGSSPSIPMRRPSRTPPTAPAATTQPSLWATARIARGSWPTYVRSVELIAPDGGDDIVACLAGTQLTVIEHRVQITGTRAALAITHALDRLALDLRPDVTLLVRGGGPAVELRSLRLAARAYRYWTTHAAFAAGSVIVCKRW